ncbi:MAG TPA: bifunctional PIG-L family deacetylase/class I SAM-dependent methyltransferase [Acidimicrobiales bacterium]|nr:bifunctional PIG-L family deacetylase/class I SAM-dependent methyltransferase [Acidimicrobiales bacterium]
MSASPDPGEWEAAIDRLPPLEVQGGRVVVVAAHPDDETLGAGGLMRALCRRGARLRLVIASDGEAAFPSLGAPERVQLGRRRRLELAEALRRLGLEDASVTWLGQPDSALDRTRLSELLRPVVKGADLCVVPWPNDPHPDHRAAGLAGRDACGPGTEVWAYPIWARARLSPAQARMPWEGGRVHRLDDGDRRAKQSAVDAFGSQVRPHPGGGEPVVGPAARRALETDREVFFRLPGCTTTPVARFESLYRRHPDPWRTRDDPYERRKRAVTLAALPAERYGRCLDAGAGTGELTLELAARCDRVLAVDAVPAAVARCREATGQLGNVSVEQVRLPDQWPQGTWDLLVFSEVLYYLDPVDLDTVIDRAEAASDRGAHLVAVDWRPVTPDAPRDGDDAHAQLLGRSRWRVMVEHIEEPFLLHVLERR